VICTGAYISYPAGITAAFNKKKLFLLESNHNPGKTISLLAARADIIYTSFDDTVNYFSSPKIQNKIRCLGNPIRKEIIQQSNATLTETELNYTYDYFGLERNKPVVLIFGGSLGARSINEGVLSILDKLRFSNYQVL